MSQLRSIDTDYQFRSIMICVLLLPAGNLLGKMLVTVILWCFCITSWYNIMQIS